MMRFYIYGRNVTSVGFRPKLVGAMGKYNVRISAINMYKGESEYEQVDWNAAWAGLNIEQSSKFVDLGRRYFPYLEKMVTTQKEVLKELKKK